MFDVKTTATSELDPRHHPPIFTSGSCSGVGPSYLTSIVTLYSFAAWIPVGLKPQFTQCNVHTAHSWKLSVI